VPRALADLIPASNDGLVTCSGDLGVAVSGVTLDSRDVRPGDVFCALSGQHAHGADFAAGAVAAGAAALLTDPAGMAACLVAAAGTEVTVVVVEDPRGLLGRVAAAAYGSPAARLRTVGVTGTNGKTTVTYLIEAAMRASGRVTGLIGTTGTHIATDVIPSARTTPEATDLHATLAVMAERGVDVVALEVSSHSLVLGRVDGLVVDVACFTNLTPDHLDFHGDMESYFAAKASLFTSERARSAVVCIDDDWGRRLVARCDLDVTTYGSTPDADWCLVSSVRSGGGQRISVASPTGVRNLMVGLAGPFNAVNAIAAAACAERIGIDVPEDAFASVAVPGRMEPVDAGQSFLVIVDYAHSPDSVARILDALRAQTDGRLMVVLGCGGDRDREKRPVMGERAAHLADLLIVTDDNPRSEDPEAIRSAMIAGIPAQHRSHVIEIADRAEAIRYALVHARSGDCVAILGKGHETGQEVAGVVHPFDDRVEARRILEGLAA
jgi:UDP-N-acetylmuramoyl-L-alanyl-D-glutamate--2,6-diaminopimelate ligase